MNHLSDIELLEYLDGENRENFSADAHVQNCAHCQSNLAVFKKLSESASHSALERTSGQFTSLIMAEVLKPEEQAAKMQIPRYWGIAVLLAAACMIIAVALNFPTATTSISNMKLDIAKRTLSFDYSLLKTEGMLQNINGFFKNPVVIMLSLAAIVMSILAGFDRMFTQRMRKF